MPASIAFIIPFLLISPSPIDFGEVPLGTRTTINVSITNTDTQPATIKTVQLRYNSYFAVLNDRDLLNYDLPVGATVVAKIEYDGSRETFNVEEDFDLDTLIVDATCGTFRVGISGVASQPQMIIDDVDAYIVDVGQRWCTPLGLRFVNPGSDTLVVTGLTGHEGSNFSLSPEAMAAMPFAVPPKQYYDLKDICYQRNDVGSDSIVVRFLGNAFSPKDTSIWTGRTVATSVDEHGTFKARWQGASVSRMLVSDLQGRILSDTGISLGSESASVTLPPDAARLVWICLFDADGRVFHRTQVGLW